MAWMLGELKPADTLEDSRVRSPNRRKLCPQVGAFPEQGKLRQEREYNVNLTGEPLAGPS